MPGRELTGIYQAMEYLPWGNRVQQGDIAEHPYRVRRIDRLVPSLDEPAIHAKILAVLADLRATLEAVRFEVRGTAQGIFSCMPGLSAVSFGITSRLAA